jgi:hypothetical protein
VIFGYLPERRAARLDPLMLFVMSKGKISVMRIMYLAGYNYFGMQSALITGWGKSIMIK